MSVIGYWDFTNIINRGRLTTIILAPKLSSYEHNFDLGFHRSESPSHVFLAAVAWMFATHKHADRQQWNEIDLAYDNMCHMDGMLATKNELPLPAPFNTMWTSAIRKMIDSFIWVIMWIIAVEQYIVLRALKLFTPNWPHGALKLVNKLSSDSENSRSLPSKCQSIGKCFFFIGSFYAVTSSGKTNMVNDAICTLELE